MFIVSNSTKRALEFSVKTVLMCSVATIVVPAPASANEAIDCGLEYVSLPVECEQDNREILVQVPAEPNTEFDRGTPQNSDGFILSIDGNPVNADPRFEDRIRKTDRALEKADIRVQFDGLGARPRLDLEILGAPEVYESGDRIQFQSRLNYPAFVTRGEVHIIDRAARGGPRTVAVVPISANGQAALVLPEGENLVAVHRVYDAKGRFDETHPLPLQRPDDRGLIDGVEEGTDATAVRRIPVRGGAVTVSSGNVSPNATITTLGETVQAAPNGAFVIQRILPSGRHDVDINVSGPAGQQFTREVEIPNNEWFYVGIADITVGSQADENGGNSSFERGRIAGYAKGKTAGGVTITAAIDSEEEDLDEVFSNLDEKDPRSTVERIDPKDGFLVFGDDSTIEDDTPTSGRFYLRVEKDNNFLLFGDYTARLTGNEYIRNERSLYGAQAEWQSQQQTENGEAKAKLQFYAAQPERLPAREVFRGTGGSIYFLQRQDITVGTSTVTVEVRDSETNQILERRLLQEGLDYTINHFQGTVRLSQPLTSSLNDGLINTNPGGDQVVNLVVQYEFTPTFGDVDGTSFGGRAEVWVTDNLRLGFSATNDSSGSADQSTYGADVLYELGERSFARLDVAASEGLGFGSSFSTDGGLIIDNTAAVDDSGEAYRASVRADFADLGLSDPGYFSAYYETRTLGFATLDYQVTAATGTEELWGFYVESTPTERLTYTLSYDDYSNQVGQFRRELGASIGYKVDEGLTLTFAAENIDRNSVFGVGDRTDVAARADFTVNEDFSYYVFGQVTAEADGLRDNDRIGVGATARLSDTVDLTGEISGGSFGPGGRVLVNYQRDENSSLYFGYELDPDREISGQDLTGEDRGRFLSGGERQINDTLSIFGESTFDLFSEGRSLTNSYGARYKPSEFLSYDLAFDLGRISDPVNGDFDRYAVSLGWRYENDDLIADGKVEYRNERGLLSGNSRDADTIALSTNLRYKIDEERRLLFRLLAINSITDQSSILDGELYDLNFGYAYRPIFDDKLNLLLSYRFLLDEFGQQIDGVQDTGPRQVSHVFNIDAIYDLNEKWTVGGKFGFRLSESAPNAATPLASNDAYLVVANARYHLVHKWDLLAEARMLEADQAGLSEFGLLAAAFRHVGNNAKIGVGYNFTSFSDDLTDLTLNDNGLFVNLVAKF